MYFLNSLGDVLKDAKVPKYLQGNITSPPLINNHLPTDRPHPRIQQLNSRLSTTAAPSTVVNAVDEDPAEQLGGDRSNTNETVTGLLADESTTPLTKPVFKSGKYRSFLKNVPRIEFNHD